MTWKKPHDMGAWHLHGGWSHEWKLCMWNHTNQKIWKV